MKITQSIFRRGRKDGDLGRIKNAWTLRLAHIDEQGRRTSKTWQFATKQAAKDEIENCRADLVKFVESKGLGLSDVQTFRQWADFAKRSFYPPAIIKNGRKVAGVKSFESAHILISHLVDCFGDKPLSTFKKYDLDRYKAWRLEQGDLRGEKGKLKPEERNPVSISTVNRGLAILKHLLNEAYSAGLIPQNITRGSKAIDADAETPRRRTLAADEERRLLMSCGGRRSVSYNRKGKSVTADITVDNPHLKAMILLGLDSGLRRGEILNLEWKYIDFDRGIIRVLGTHTKTQKPRSTPLTERTREELRNLSNFGEPGKVFPFSSFKRSWKTAIKIAGIED